jgi:cytochrome b561
MEIYDLIVPTGIASFALFVFALINGVPRFRLLRYHAITGYACCAIVLVHSAAAILCFVIEPLGVLASIGMLLTTASGFFRWKLRAHVTLAILTLVFSVLHVAVILYMK